MNLRKYLYDIPYRNLKSNYTNELLLQNRNREVFLTEGERVEGREGIVREFGIDMYMLLYSKWKTKKAAAIYILTKSVGGFLSLHILSSIYYS